MIRKTLTLPIKKPRGLHIRRILGLPEAVKRHPELQSRRTLSVPITRTLSVPITRTFGLSITRTLSLPIKKTLGVRIRRTLGLTNEVAFSPPKQPPTKLRSSVYNNVSQDRIVPRPQ